MPKARTAPKDRAQVSSSRPGLEFAVASGADLDRQLPYARAEPGEGHGGVGVLVGVDADDDVGG